MVFCFKQKAAYEVRISDWSSDVCSSDLCVGPRTDGGDDWVNSLLHFYDSFASIGRTATTQEQLTIAWRERWDDDIDLGGTRTQLAVGASRLRADADLRLRGHSDGGRARSEEHTSELQSLMRISYAVFCLKKQKPITTTKHT